MTRSSLKYVPLLALLALALAGIGQAAGNPPTNRTPPTITGNAQQGSTLTAHHGQWDGDTPITYKWQWRSCNDAGGACADIAGATSQAYVVPKAQVGHRLRVAVTATNAAGSNTAVSQPTEVVTAKSPPPPPPTNSNGCPTGSGTADVSGISPPARLNVDGQSISPSIVTGSTTDLTVRFHVSACSGRSVSGALVYVTAVPFEQFSIPAEQPTGSDGWATLTMHRLGGFPAARNQQLLVMFARARKSGEPTLGGISTRRLVSFPVRLNG